MEVPGSLSWNETWIGGEAVVALRELETPPGGLGELRNLFDSQLSINVRDGWMVGRMDGLGGINHHVIMYAEERKNTDRSKE